MNKYHYEVWMGRWLIAFGFVEARTPEDAYRGALCRLSPLDHVDYRQSTVKAVGITPVFQDGRANGELVLF